MKAKYPDYKVKTSGPPKFMVGCLGCLMCNNEMKAMYPRMGVKQHWDNSKAQKILGINFKNAVESGTEMAEQIIQDKYVRGNN